MNSIFCSNDVFRYVCIFVCFPCYECDESFQGVSTEEMLPILSKIESWRNVPLLLKCFPIEYLRKYAKLEPLLFTNFRSASF